MELGLQRRASDVRASRFAYSYSFGNEEAVDGVFKANLDYDLHLGSGKHDRSRRKSRRRSSSKERRDKRRSSERSSHGHGVHDRDHDREQGKRRRSSRRSMSRRESRRSQRHSGAYGSHNSMVEAMHV